MQTAVRECLTLFGAESFSLHFDVQNYKGQDTEKYNFAFCFEWV